MSMDVHINELSTKYATTYYVMMREPSPDASESRVEQTVTPQALFDDLSLRFSFYGSSLKILDSLSALTKAVGDHKRRRQCFSLAIELAPVNTNLVESFLRDPDLLSTFAADTADFAQSKELLQCYFRAAALVSTPVVWSYFMRLAFLPEVDFTTEELSTMPTLGPLTGPPLLFPAPDLFLGVLDLPEALALITMHRQRWAAYSTEVEEVGSSIDALFGGTEFSAVHGLLVSALSIGGHHPKDGYLLWQLVRERAFDDFQELLEKWQAGPMLEETMSDAPRVCAIHADDSTSTNLAADLVSAAWKLRLLFYRQLSIPSLHLSEVLDEYRLFESELPDGLRVLELPPGVAVDDADQVAESLGKAVNEKLTPEQVERDKERCIALAEKLANNSTRKWRRRKKAELEVSSALEGGDQPSSGGEQMDEDMPSEIAGNLSAWRQREILSGVWTQYVNAEEEELVRLMVRSTQTPQLPPAASAASSIADGEGSTGAPTDLLVFLENILVHARNQATAQKRQVATTYMRAIDHMGDVRLDLFEGFHAFLNRASADHAFVPTSKWLPFWTLWGADQACRNQPLKSCCWERLFQTTARIAADDNDELADAMAAFTNSPSGVFWRFLNGPPWWRVFEVRPGLLEGGAPRIPSHETLQTHTSEFLHGVAFALRAVEDLHRVFQAQGSQTADGDASSALVAALESLFGEADRRVMEFVVTLIDLAEQSSGTVDISPIMPSLFAALLNLRGLRGIYLARLQRPVLEFATLFQAIDSICEVFRPYVDSENFEPTIWNLKVGITLMPVVCSDLRYYSGVLRGSWLSSCLVRGELNPRVISKTLIAQPVDQSFQVVLQRLADDEGFADAKTRPALLRQLDLLSDTAAAAVQGLQGTGHPILIVFAWMAQLRVSLNDGHEWTLPEEVPEHIPLAELYPLPPPSVFPKLGTPLRVTLDDLEMRPFQTSSRKAPTSTANGTESVRSVGSGGSSSSSDAGSLPEPLSHTLSPRLADSSPVRLGSPITVPSRRMSAENLEQLTRSTFEGLESAMPSLAPPGIPPQLPAHDHDDRGGVTQKASEFPAPASPVAFSASRRVSTETSAAHDESMESPSSAAEAEAEVEGLVEPQRGRHFLQQRLGESASKEDEVRLLGARVVEWNTLYISNLDATVKTSQLEHEINALGCAGLKELRLVKDRAGRAKGFAYAEFESAEHAALAEKLLNGWKIQDRSIMAKISVPKGPVYEANVLFVSHLPIKVTGEKVKRLIEEVKSRWDGELQPPSRKRRASTDRDTKKPRMEVSESTESSETREQALHEQDVDKAAGMDWRVKEVRIATTPEGESKGYGYIEFDRTQGAQLVLQQVRLNPEQFVLEGSQLVIAPSVPKKPPNIAKVHKAKPPPQQLDPAALARNLFFNSLPFSLTEAELREICEPFGVVTNVAMPMAGKRNRGFAYVEYEKASDAVMARSSLDGSELKNRAISVDQSTRMFAAPKPKGEGTAISERRSTARKHEFDEGQPPQRRDQPKSRSKPNRHEKIRSEELPKPSRHEKIRSEELPKPQGTQVTLASSNAEFRQMFFD